MKLEMVGKRFGRFVVLERQGNSKNGHPLWVCKCDCGSIRKVGASNLRTGNSKSCGCWDFARKKSRRLESWEPAFNNLFRRYQMNACRRGYVWELTKFQFLELTRGNCRWCGIAPYQVEKRVQKNTGWKTEYVYSGIDRVNNSLGYLIENCVSCCPVCNKAKGTLNLEQWKIWISRLFKNIGSWQGAD